MDDKPPWDGLRAAFYLVAAMLMLQALYVGGAVVWCMTSASDAIIAGKFQCNRDNQLAELLNAALTTALAFAMAFLNQKNK